jgi:ligand-binding sensor domain-containing protein
MQYVHLVFWVLAMVYKAAINFEEMHNKPLLLNRRVKTQLFLRLLLSALILSAFVSDVNAQDIKFTSITSRDGLSSNTINAILKDDDGYMWFATPEGVDRFNGRDIKGYGFIQTIPPVFRLRKLPRYSKISLAAFGLAQWAADYITMINRLISLSAIPGLATPVTLQISI